MIRTGEPHVETLIRPSLLQSPPPATSTSTGDVDGFMAEAAVAGFGPKRLYKDLLKASKYLAQKQNIPHAVLADQVRRQFKQNMAITNAEEVAKCIENAKRALVNFAAHEMSSKLPPKPNESST